MRYRIGNKDDIKAQGETLPIICPHCNNKVRFSVYSNGNTELIPTFPIVKNTKVFFLVCPQCASVYTVDEERGKSFQKGETLAIGNFDLTEPEVFNA